MTLFKTCREILNDRIRVAGTLKLMMFCKDVWKVQTESELLLKDFSSNIFLAQIALF